MRIAICDDEALCLSQVTAVADEYVLERKEDKYVFDTFSHAEDLLESAEKTGGYDIYILDVVMPDMNGIDLGVNLRNAGYDGKIIYLTSSAEYALDSFKVKAFDYIIKPIQKDAFFKVMDEAALSVKDKKDKCILVKSKERSIKIPLDSIMYAELSQRTVIYNLVGGKSISSITIRTNFTDAVSKLLEDKRFVLCGAGMAVNLDHVTEVENDAVVFDNTYRPFLGEKLCRKLRSDWSNYLFE